MRFKRGQRLTNDVRLIASQCHLIRCLVCGDAGGGRTEVGTTGGVGEHGEGEADGVIGGVGLDADQTTAPGEAGGEGAEFDVVGAGFLDGVDDFIAAPFDGVGHECVVL